MFAERWDEEARIRRSAYACPEFVGRTKQNMSRTHANYCRCSLLGFRNLCNPGSPACTAYALACCRPSHTPGLSTSVGWGILVGVAEEQQRQAEVRGELQGVWGDPKTHQDFQTEGQAGEAQASEAGASHPPNCCRRACWIRPCLLDWSGGVAGCAGQHVAIFSLRGYACTITLWGGACKQ